MWSAIASALLGFVGWFSAKFLFEPLKEIIDLRRNAQECLIVYGDLKPNASDHERDAAAERFVHIGASLVSHHFAAFPWVRRALRFWPQWDIHSAGDNMIALGRVIKSEGFSHPNLSGDVVFIRQSLKLPKPEKSAVLLTLEEAVQQPHYDDD